MALALSHLKIKTRLYGAFGLLNVLALLIAGFGANRLWQVGAGVNVMNFTAEQTSLLQ
ncbi:MAG: hypothetical protein ACJ8AW_51160 [Rhodopila sp.]